MLDAEHCRWKITKFAGTSPRNLLTPETEYDSVGAAKLAIDAFKAFHPQLTHLPVRDWTK
jgi:hypothetical protein